MDIDGGALLGLVEKGESELAAQPILLKIVRKINQLFKEGDSNM